MKEFLIENKVELRVSLNVDSFLVSYVDSFLVSYVDSFLVSYVDSIPFDICTAI